MACSCMYRLTISHLEFNFPFLSTKILISVFPFFPRHRLIYMTLVLCIMFDRISFLFAQLVRIIDTMLVVCSLLAYKAQHHHKHPHSIK